MKWETLSEVGGADEAVRLSWGFGDEVGRNDVYMCIYIELSKVFRTDGWTDGWMDDRWRCTICPMSGLISKS